MLNEIFAGVYFCGLAIFCVLQELIFTIRTDWFFLLGINFCNFRKHLVHSIDNISFLLSTCNRNTYLQTILSVRQYLFVEKKRSVVIEQTRFLGTVFLCSEFKLESTVFPLE